MYIIFFQSTYQIEKRPPFLYNNTEYMLSSGQFLRHSFDLCIRAIGVYEKLVGGRTLNMAKHTDRNFVDNFLQVVIYLALVANI